MNDLKEAIKLSLATHLEKNGSSLEELERNLEKNGGALDWIKSLAGLGGGALKAVGEIGIPSAMLAGTMVGGGLYSLNSGLESSDKARAKQLQELELIRRQTEQLRQTPPQH
jgi:hypothetical protein